MTKKEIWKERIGRLFHSKLFWFLVILFIVVLLFRNLVMEQAQVGGQSMEPTLSDGDILLVEKRTYEKKNPERYDIIVLNTEGNSMWGQQYVKRIIGLPGETVQIEEGKILINGKKLKEPFDFEEIEDGGLAREEIQLGEDEYFVLGDNRNNSKDSRHLEIGTVNQKQIQGRVFMRIYPFQHIGAVNTGKEQGNE